MIKQVNENWGKVKVFFKSLQKSSEMKSVQKTLRDVSAKAEPLKTHPVAIALKKAYNDLSAKVKAFFRALRRYPRVGIVGNAGICAGIAYQLKTEVLYIRLILLLGFLTKFWLFGLAYFILWVFVPKAETPEDYKELCDKERKGSFYRINTNGFLGGICAGLAHRLKVKTLVVRLVWLGSYVLFGEFLGMGELPVMLYMICWIAWPEVGLPKDYAEICVTFKQLVRPQKDAAEKKVARKSPRRKK